MSSAGRCAFCGQLGSSEEDVFAKWIAGVVGGEGPFHLRRAHGRNKTNMRYIGLTTRAACRVCNNEWMSGFEQSVMPLLTPVVQNRPTQWVSGDDRTTVARWAFKTALMLDRSGRPEKWTTPDKDFRYLFEHREPPPSASILVAHYAPQQGEEFFPVWAASASMPGNKLPGGEIFDGYRITFSVGHAIFRAYGLADRDRDGFVFESTLDLGDRRVEDAFRRLWPLGPEPHDWPPRGANFATSGLAYLEQGGQ